MKSEWFNNPQNRWYFIELFEDSIGGTWFLLRFRGDNDGSKYKKLIFFSTREEAVEEMKNIHRKLKKKGYERIQ